MGSPCGGARTPNGPSCLTDATWRFDPRRSPGHFGPRRGAWLGESADVDLAQTQLMILQQEVARHQSSNAQLQQRVTMSDDSVRLVRSQVDAMRENQQQARHNAAQFLRNSCSIL